MQLLIDLIIEYHLVVRELRNWLLVLENTPDRYVQVFCFFLSTF
jgi:hypothetical protein